MNLKCQARDRLLESRTNTKTWPITHIQRLVIRRDKTPNVQTTGQEQDERSSWLPQNTKNKNRR